MKIYVDLDHVDITEYTQIESGEYNTNKINFIFTPEYKDLVKVAIFGCKLDTDEPKFYKIYLSDDSCYLPSEVTAASDVISIGVYAFNVDNGELKLRYSPTPVKTIVYEGSFREEAENASSPTPTEIEQIMSRIISLEEITSDLNTRVEALENKACDLDTLKSDVAELKDDVENISGRVDTIESDIDDLEGDIANTYSKTEVDTLLGNKVDTTTFNSSQAAQDEKIAKAELILSQLPKVTGEGTNFSLSPTIEYDLEVESLLGDTIQEGTPTPDTPVPIQVVTGTQEIEVCGKNMFNPTNITFATGILDDNGNPASSSASHYTNNYWRVKPSTLYYISGTLRTTDTAYRLYYYDINKNWISRTTLINTTGYSFGTPSNCYYFRLQVANEVTLNDIQLEYGSSATTYEPYQGQTYTLHLGDLELAKIGAAQDYIYKSGDKWYKHQVIDEVIYNGDQTFTKIRDYVFSSPNLSNAVFPSNTSETMQCYCNYYTPIPNTATWNNYDYMISYRATQLTFRNKDTQGSTDFESWLSTHNTKVKYIMVTPINIEITDTTLIEELNSLYNAYSKYGTTNIQVEGTLAGGLKVRALKQLS